MHRLFNQLLAHGVFPDSWKVAKCVPIPKPGRSDHGNPQNLCPISLLSCLGKTFEKVIAARLASEAEATGAITKQQMGSRSSLSAMDTLMVTLTAAQEWNDTPAVYSKIKGLRQPRASIAAHDVEGAFNCVVHSRLQELFTHFNFSGNLIKLIGDFNTNRKIFMTFDNQDEQPVKFDAGVPQGSPLSPILYLIYSSTLSVPTSDKSTRERATWMMSCYYSQRSLRPSQPDASRRERMTISNVPPS